MSSDAAGLALGSQPMAERSARPGQRRPAGKADCSEAAVLSLGLPPRLLSLFPSPHSTAHSHLMLFTNRFPGVISFAAPTPGVEGQIGAISQSLLSERRLEKVSFYAPHR